MNNTLKLFCLASLAVIGLASCSKNTDLEPSSKLEPSNKNENNVKEENLPKDFGTRTVFMYVVDNRKDQSRNIDFQFSKVGLHCDLYRELFINGSTHQPEYEFIHNDYRLLKNANSPWDIYIKGAGTVYANFTFSGSDIFDWGQEILFRYQDDAKDNDFIRMRIDGTAGADHPGDIRVSEKWRRDDIPNNVKVSSKVIVGTFLDKDEWVVFVKLRIED